GKIAIGLTVIDNSRSLDFTNTRQRRQLGFRRRIDIDLSHGNTNGQEQRNQHQHNATFLHSFSLFLDRIFDPTETCPRIQAISIRKPAFQTSATLNRITTRIPPVARENTMADSGLRYLGALQPSASANCHRSGVSGDGRNETPPAERLDGRCWITP